jgi:hypothetical protein
MLSFGYVRRNLGGGGKLPPGISRLTDEIEAKFQRLIPYFRVKLFDCAGENTAGRNRKSEIKHGRRRAVSTHILNPT